MFISDTLKFVLRYVFFFVLLSIFTSGTYAQLTGTKTIGGTTPDYATIEDAITALNTAGTADPGVTFLIRSGTYTPLAGLSITTTTGTATAPIEFRPDAGATVVVNVLTSSSGVAWTIAANSGYITINGSNTGSGSDRNLTITNISPGPNTGIKGAGTNIGCTLKNLNVSTGATVATDFISSSCRGIDQFYGGASESNNFSIINCSVTNAGIGIRVEGNSTVPLLSGTLVRNNIVNNVGLYGIYIIYSIAAQVYNNDIQVPNGTGVSVYGIALATANAGNFRVYNNIVHNVKSSSTSTGGSIVGIYLSSTSTANSRAGSVFNNFIYDINATGVSGTVPVYGIQMTAASANTAPDTIAYNSINLSGSTSNTRVAAAFAFTGTTVTNKIYLRNNILCNALTGPTFAIGILKSATGTIMTSNNNDIYVGSTGATRLTGRIVLVDYQTIADWRTGSSNDANSFAENPAFTSATDLHIPNSTATQLESGGFALTNITTDIDGTTRNASTPDVGADEFTGVAVDLSAPTITYTLLTNSTVSPTKSVSGVTITDPSSVNVTAGTAPRIYYKRSTDANAYNDNTSSTDGWKFSEADNASSPFSFTINFNKLNGGTGVAIDQFIQYFVVAQDLAPATNVGINSGVFAAPPTSVNLTNAAFPLTGTINQFKIVDQPLAAGDYTVGAALLQKIFGNNVEKRLVTRMVEKQIPIFGQSDKKSTRSDKSNSISTLPYEGEIIGYETKLVEEKTEEIYVNNQLFSDYLVLTEAQKSGNGLYNVNGIFPTLAAAFTALNERGVNGAVRLLLTDATYTEGPLTLNSVVGASAVNTITLKPNTGVTASITNSATSALLVIKTSYFTLDGSNTDGGTTRDLSITNTSVTTPSCVLLGSTGTTPLVNGTVKNCIITNGVNTSTPLIVSDGGTPGSAGYFNNITIQNNIIRKAYIGIYTTGVVGSASNLSILSNDLTSTGTDAIRYTGIYTQGFSNGLIQSNRIGNFDGASAEDDRGMWVAAGSTNFLVNRNEIFTLKYTGTSGYGGYGIAASTSTAGSGVVISNNVIYDISGDGWSTSVIGDNPFGMYLFGTQTGLKVLNNSVYLSGNTLNQTGATSGGLVLGTGTTAEVRNNILVNNLGLLAATGYGSTGLFLQTDATQLEASDNNVFFVSPTGSGAINVALFNATPYNTLSDYQTASSKDQSSYFGDPAYTSTTNLMPDITNPNSWTANGKGFPNAFVTTDFNGTLRSTSVAGGSTDIGAFEFTPLVSPPAATENAPPAVSTTTTYTMNQKQLGSIFWVFGATPPTSINFVYYSGTNPPGGGSRIKSNCFWSVIPTGGSGYLYNITFNYDEAELGGISPETDIRLAKSTDGGATWTPFLVPDDGSQDPGMYTLNTTTNTITVYQLDGFSLFALTDTDSPLPVELVSFTSIAKDRNIVLNWETKTERNSSKYIIERSDLNLLNWISVGEVNANGNTNTPVKYSFTDKKLSSGKFEYRLKMIDMDGQYAYSNKISADIELPKSYSLSQNYPNPFNPSTRIDYQLPVDARVTIELFSVTGEKVAELINSEQNAGYYTLDVNSSSLHKNLASGVYIYRLNAVDKVSGNNFVNVKKMLMLK